MLLLISTASFDDDDDDDDDDDTEMNLCATIENTGVRLQLQANMVLALVNVLMILIFPYKSMQDSNVHSKIVITGRL